MLTGVNKYQGGSWIREITQEPNNHARIAAAVETISPKYLRATHFYRCIQAKEIVNQSVSF